MSQEEKYFGKYRGTVVNNVDPLQIGRILVMVPDVSGIVPTSWAMPCSHRWQTDGLILCPASWRGCLGGI